MVTVRFPAGGANLVHGRLQRLGGHVVNDDPAA